jgi:hypothetical protein
MIGKLLGRSWGVMVMAVLFATAVNAQELASARSNSARFRAVPEGWIELEEDL